MQQNVRNKFGLTDRDMATLVSILKKYSEITEVYIFGSRAKGTWQTGSDIDLAIANDTVSFKTLLALKTDFEESTLPYKVDLVHVSQLKTNSLIEHIKRAGILFYHSEKMLIT